MQLNGVGQHDDQSVHGSCDIGYRVAVTVVVQEVTCMWTDHEGDARTRPPTCRGCVPVGRTLSAALEGEIAQCPQHAEEGHGGEHRDVGGNGKRLHGLVLQ